MNNIKYQNGIFFLAEGNQYKSLLNVRLPIANKSCVSSHQFSEKSGVIYPLEKMTTDALKKIFQNTVTSFAEMIAYSRIVARLLTKPQIHSVLQIGNWSAFGECLSAILPHFNPQNKFCCMTSLRPVGKIPTVNFIFNEGSDYLLPENKFDSVVFTEKVLPPPEVFLSVKDYGRIYFIAEESTPIDEIKSNAIIYNVENDTALVETEMTPQLREKFYLRTPQGQLNEKISAIRQLVNQVPIILRQYKSSTGKNKKSLLDKYIAELIRAEKVLAEIFPMLRDADIKFNFNLLKEFLIDLRLDNGSPAQIESRYKILAQSLTNT
ncbi:MAG: hypothetical protein K6G55_03515 [Selenomonadaceae bacterium]|nr:hypothetical protein [Selenomonadaceae bacterium]